MTMPAMGSSVYLTRIDPMTEKYLPHQGRRKVFISYKQTDNALTNRCKIIADKILRMVDCAVWYDTKLTPGKDYDNEIYQAISECDVVVLLLTENILKSTYVWENEIAAAKKQQKPIIPIIFDINPSDYTIAMERIGSHIQALKWPSGGENGKVSPEAQHFDDSFSRALDHFIVDVDLGLSIKRFFDSELCNYSPSKLMPMQIYYMGYGYLRGLYTEKNVEKGIALLDSVIAVYGDDEETLKLKGDAAHALHSHFYTLGEYSQAFKYAEKGASFKHINSLYSLGYLYVNGEGIDTNPKKGMEYLLSAADMGDVRSMYYLGDIYRWGIGTEENVSKAVEYFARAAELGHANSLVSLGQIYLYGSGSVAPDIQRAFSLLNKAVELGNEEANYLLGNTYYLGLGVNKDLSKAVRYLTRAARAGFPDAFAILGIIYDSGEFTEKDPAKAFAYFARAAELGSTVALYFLATKYEDGDGVPCDKEKAAEYYAKYNEWMYTANPMRGDKTPAELIKNAANSIAADCNDPQQLYIAAAAFLTAKDSEKCIEYFTKAAELGHVESAYTLASLYYMESYELGIPQDIDKALYWYTAAAENGSSDAAYVIAVTYDTGEGVEKDEEKAIRWYKKAYELGNSDAAFNLGVLYCQGLDGQEPDFDTAMNWFKKSSELGNTDAEQAIAEILDAQNSPEDDIDIFEDEKEEACIGNIQGDFAEMLLASLTPKERRFARKAAKRRAKLRKKEEKRALKAEKKNAKKA